jgi:triosephosphate isomerase
MRRYVIAANWKMHGNGDMTKDWFGEFTKQMKSDAASNKEIVVCPPFPYLSLAKEMASGTANIGAQNVSDEIKGAFTGQVSATMLKDSGCDYVIIGHSERRAINHETDALIAKKVQRALESKLIPILCVGETLTERQQNKTEQVIAKQLLSVLDTLTDDQVQTLIVAYEPVWAIGTGLAATTEQAQAVHAFLRAEIGKRSKQYAEVVRIIYGGSVKPENALELLAMPDIDGALVGGASLDAHAFAQIVNAAK